MTGVIVTLTGPSCSGKSTLESLLVREPFYRKVISTTTRAPRAGETDGREYHFVTRERFDKMVEADEFVEIVEFGGNAYGATKGEFEAIKNGENVVIVCEPSGRDEIVQYADENGLPVIPVFLTNPTNVLADRFIERTLSDFTLAMTKAGASEKVIKAATVRLDMMLSEEREWSPSSHPYAMTFNKFDSVNERAVVMKILSVVEALSE